MGLGITDFEFIDQVPGVENILIGVFLMYNVYLVSFVNDHEYDWDIDNSTAIDIAGRITLLYPTICDIPSRKLRRYGGVGLHKNQVGSRTTIPIWWESNNRNLIGMNMVSKALLKLGGLQNHIGK
jgi:hypothetical protein